MRQEGASRCGLETLSDDSHPPLVKKGAVGYRISEKVFKIKQGSLKHTHIAKSGLGDLTGQTH